MFWALNQQIRMISEGSCDIEDFSSQEYVTFQNIFKNKSGIYICNTISHYHWFYCIFIK